MKNKKGFTLVELLAVIVVLAIIMVIATPNVLKAVKESKLKARYTAAKEIVEIASAYMEEKNLSCVSVEDLVFEDYLEDDVTNPSNGENRTLTNRLNHKIISGGGFSEQIGYEPQSNKYIFSGYQYDMDDGSCS